MPLSPNSYGPPDPRPPHDTPSGHEEQDLGDVAGAPADRESAQKVDCDERGVIRSGRLKGLSMWGAIVVLAWPVLLESFLNALVGLVDTVVAARISTAATDAIGVASYFQWFMGMLTIALGVGATALISRAVGRGRTAFAGVVFGQVITIGLVLGIATGAIIFAFADSIALFLKIDAGTDTFAYTVDYLRIVSLAVPAVTVLFGGIACSRGVGETLKPMLIMAMVNAINVACTVVLAGVPIAYTPPGAEEPLIAIPALLEEGLGVRGIAWGTCIAWYCGACMVVALMLKGISGVRLAPRRLRPHRSTIARLVRVGTPNFFETAGMWLGNFIVFRFLGLAGAEVLFGAHIVAVRAESFSFMPGFGMAIAASTLVGQYLGAKRPDLARLAIRRCTLVAGAIMGALGLFYILIPDLIVSVYSEQPEHRELVPPLLITCGLIQIPFAIAIVVRGALRGAGDTKVVMGITWTMVWGVRLPLAWLGSGVDLPLPFGDAIIPNPAPLRQFGIGPLLGVWIGLCSELILRPIPFIIRYLSGKWTLIRV
ncbi:MAG: MATE family efflux transporter [Planctomycetota bacterium]